MRCEKIRGAKFMKHSMKIRGMKNLGENKGCELFLVLIRGTKKRLRGAKISMENSRGAKISMKNLRGAKISVENIRGRTIFHHFPKNTPTGYPELKKTGPLYIHFLFSKINKFSFSFIERYFICRKPFV